MKTSYFGNLRNVSNPLSISGKAPDWYKGPQFKTLAPKRGFFSAYKSGRIDDAGYVEAYFEQVLQPLDATAIWQQLTTRYGDDVTLLCYEKPGDFCHRRIVADWFEETLKK
jgi:hypothetical protein